jgi:hypothetical protein
MLKDEYGRSLKEALADECQLLEELNNHPEKWICVIRSKIIFTADTIGELHQKIEDELDDNGKVNIFYNSLLPFGSAFQTTQSFDPAFCGLKS